MAGGTYTFDWCRGPSCPSRVLLGIGEESGGDNLVAFVRVTQLFRSSVAQDFSISVSSPEERQTATAAHKIAWYVVRMIQGCDR